MPPHLPVLGQAVAPSLSGRARLRPVPYGQAMEVPSLKEGKPLTTQVVRGGITYYGFLAIMKERYQMLLANDIDNGADDEDYLFIASRCRKHIESLD